MDNGRIQSQYKLGLKKLLSNCGSLGVAITGNSMAPALNDGDVVCVETVHEESDIAIGCIVLFVRYARLILHRVINIQNNYCFVKGDNETEVDIVKKSNIIGVLKKDGYIKEYSGLMEIPLIPSGHFEVTISKGVIDSVAYHNNQSIDFMED